MAGGSRCLGARCFFFLFVFPLKAEDKILRRSGDALVMGGCYSPDVRNAVVGKGGVFVWEQAPVLPCDFSLWTFRSRTRASVSHKRNISKASPDVMMKTPFLLDDKLAMM